MLLPQPRVLLRLVIQRLLDAVQVLARHPPQVLQQAIVRNLEASDLSVRARTSGVLDAVQVLCRQLPQVL